MELVAKPIPKVMEDSTPRKLATSSSSSSWMLRLPARDHRIALSGDLLICVTASLSYATGKYTCIYIFLQIHWTLIMGVLINKNQQLLSGAFKKFKRTQCFRKTWKMGIDWCV